MALLPVLAKFQAAALIVQPTHDPALKIVPSAETSSPSQPPSVGPVFVSDPSLAYPTIHASPFAISRWWLLQYLVLPLPLEGVSKERRTSFAKKANRCHPCASACQIWLLRSSRRKPTLDSEIHWYKCRRYESFSSMGRGADKWTRSCILVKSSSSDVFQTDLGISQSLHTPQQTTRKDVDL